MSNSPSSPIFQDVLDVNVFFDKQVPIDRSGNIFPLIAKPVTNPKNRPVIQMGFLHKFGYPSWSHDEYLRTALCQIIQTEWFRLAYRLQHGMDQADLRVGGFPTVQLLSFPQVVVISPQYEVLTRHYGNDYPPHIEAFLQPERFDVVVSSQDVTHPKVKQLTKIVLFPKIHPNAEENRKLMKLYPHVGLTIGALVVDKTCTHTNPSDEELLAFVQEKRGWFVQKILSDEVISDSTYDYSHPCENVSYTLREGMMLTLFGMQVHRTHTLKVRP